MTIKIAIERLNNEADRFTELAKDYALKVLKTDDVREGTEEWARQGRPQIHGQGPSVARGNVSRRRQAHRQTQLLKMYYLVRDPKPGFRDQRRRYMTSIGGWSYDMTKAATFKDLAEAQARLRGRPDFAKPLYAGGV
ncbi:MAG TPA: hypothetical protein PKA41_08720 [Verrucomicrobiota bacterium]|nr:hypothetical protein [Verrucomicrobiota bacterium]